MGTTHCLVFAAALLSAQATGNPEWRETSCQEFSRGVRFNDSQAVGVWWLLGDRLSVADRTALCVEFTPATQEERKELSDSIGQYLANLQWDNVSLKMQLTVGPYTILFYLERLGPDGSYLTLEAPDTNKTGGGVKPSVSSLQRHSMRLKTVDRYLALMDCPYPNITMLLARDADRDELRMRNIVRLYWPDETDKSDE